MQVAVMLDGPEWSGRPTMADRDSAPTLLRSIMGWPAKVRFWLPSWIRRRAAVLDQIDEAVAEANAAQPKELVVEQPAAAEPTADLEIPQPQSANDAESAFAATAPVPAPRRADHRTRARRAGPERRGAVAHRRAGRSDHRDRAVHGGGIPASPFVPYVPDLIGDQADIDLLGSDRRVRTLVRDTLHEIIAAEGPIEQHRLARLTLARFGFLRASRRPLRGPAGKKTVLYAVVDFFSPPARR